MTATDDGGFFAEFDAYCEANNISEAETPMAFAAFLNLKTGWDGDARPALSAPESEQHE